MSWRRLAVLVRKLITDPNSMTCRVYGAPDFTIEQYMLADIRESLSGQSNPWRGDIQRAQRSQRAREIEKRQKAWESRHKPRG